MRWNKICYITKVMLIGLVILTAAIALPILFRSFYFWHIEPMELGQSLGLDGEQVKTAYNQMLDYCMGITDSFSVGVLPFSEDGAAHFADVRALFLLDLRVLVASAVLLAVIYILPGKKRLSTSHTPGFWSAIGLISGFVLVGCLAALDFDRAFAVFHRVFFPGETNWLFDPLEDPVILLLPWEFFRNCGILIFLGILFPCAGLILWDLFKKKKEKGVR